MNEDALISSPVLSVEAEAARLASLVPRHTSRLTREAGWYFRTYQGGEAYQRIDWRQSGRKDELLVRDYEPIQQPPVVLWTDHDEGNISAHILLLALARLLLSDDRAVCWLSPETRPAHTITHVESQRLMSMKEAQNEALRTTTIPLPPPYCLVLAAPFADRAESWRTRLKTLARQGGRGILIDLSHPPLPKHAGLYKSAAHLDWPVFRLKQGMETIDLLPELLKTTLKLTL
jgi:hypothetical protein